MHEHGWLPRARENGLLEEAIGEELLLYDQESHTAHCMSPIAACVWRHCDGEHDLTGLAQLVGTSESLVVDALHELREKDLLVAESQLIKSTIPGESRREAIVRVARYGAAVTAGSMIVSATAATPAMAVSGSARCKPKVKDKNCCICKNEQNSCTNKNFEECFNFCEEKNRGGFGLFEAEAECEIIA